MVTFQIIPIAVDDSPVLWSFIWDAKEAARWIKSGGCDHLIPIFFWGDPTDQDFFWIYTIAMKDRALFFGGNSCRVFLWMVLDA